MKVFSPSVNAETYLISGKATYADNSPVPLEYVTVECEEGNYDCYQHRGSRVMTNAYGDFTLMLDVENEDNGLDIFLSLRGENFTHIINLDGLGDSGPYIPSIKAKDDYAIGKIISIINKHPNEIEIIAIGPLTNIAKVFINEPSVIKKIKSLYIMGGIGEGKGNITEYAEFNFWVDPDAADIVLNSNIDIKMIGWDVTQIYGYLNKKNFNDLKKINTNLSRFAIDIQRKGLEYYKVKYNEHKIDLADPLAMAVMINDSETNYKKCNIKIILDGEKRGKDIISFNNNGNVNLATQVSRSNFLNTLKKSLV